jgi:plasmid replication initiation protein
MGLNGFAESTEGNNLERFAASFGDFSAKDQIDLMSRCWFSLTANRNDPIEHEFRNAKTSKIETVRITGSAEHGIATIHDNDLIIFAISQWVEARNRGEEPSRRIAFTPYQYFAWTNKAPHGTAYQRLKDSLHRLKTTNIETSIRSPSDRKGRLKQFSWISEWSIDEKGDKAHGVEVVLAEWLFESIQDYNVLTIDKRYFEISGGVERWLYLHAKKATGNTAGVWRESFKSLHKKSASQQAYKHYAHALRKLIERNELPGLNLSRHISARKEEMLGMERTEKREQLPRPSELQLPLLEEVEEHEAWENVLEILCRQLGTDVVASWFKQVRFISIEAGTLRLKAPTKFVAGWIESRYLGRLRSAFEETGKNFDRLTFEIPAIKKAA